MAKSVKIICGGDEFMVHWPNGAVEFVGFWSLIRLCWWLVRNRKSVTIVDGETGKETKA